MTTIQCIVSSLRPISSRSRPTTQITATPGTLWTVAVQNCPAQCGLVESSVPEDVDFCSAWGDGDPLGREMISVDSAVRRTPSHLGHATEPDMRNLLQAANAPQAVMDPSSRFSCSQCDEMTAPRIPRGVAIPQTVAPLRSLAMDVKWSPGYVRMKSVNTVEEGSNVHHTETSQVLLMSLDTCEKLSEMAESACQLAQIRAPTKPEWL